MANLLTAVHEAGPVYCDTYHRQVSVAALHLVLRCTHLLINIKYNASFAIHQNNGPLMELAPFLIKFPLCLEFYVRYRR